MIAVQQLTKQFGQHRALDRVSFTVQQGEVVGFLGPNGAGKTTTLRILTGFISASSGSVTIADQELLDQPIASRQKIGYLSESNPLYDAMRVYEYLRFVAQAKAVPDIISDIRRVVTACHLAEKITASISDLSKGYRQRVGLAAALLGDPDILLLDEPTSGLDPNQAADIRELIRTIGQTKTVLFSTHILQEAQASCDRALIINRGSIVADGTIDQLLNQAQGSSQVTVEIEGSQAIIMASLKQLTGVEQVQAVDQRIQLTTTSQQDVRRSIFQLCVDRGWTLLAMTRTTVSLEDVFRQLTA
ncbi:MAG: ATP-binding cassette domain-containing protein [Candidatus Kerfeldbacteria bacterium]|nr:ATP-binding cassette domain-containing protein [Candidatus Kerfeldbacteria bacterium]